MTSAESSQAEARRQVQPSADLPRDRRTSHRTATALKRADPPLRKLNAWGWKLLVNGLFGYTARDVDCAFKLFRRQVCRSVTTRVEPAARPERIQR